MQHATPARWRTLCLHLAGVAPPDTLFDALVQQYAEPHRAYHTLTHIDACLAHFDEVRHLAVQPDLIEAAIWLHDVIYEPTRSDNEAASAQWAETCLLQAGVAANKIAQIRQLILYTQHNRPPPTGDPALLVDIDLAILGASVPRFAAYEQQIREEYAWVPWPTYAAKRAALLQQFLARPRLYQTPALQRVWEAAARHNLYASLKRLKNKADTHLT